jgi:hypothetical protein
MHFNSSRAAFALCLAVSLTACGGGGQESVDTAAVAATIEAPGADAAPVADVHVTALSAQTSASAGKPPAAAPLVPVSQLAPPATIKTDLLEGKSVAVPPNFVGTHLNRWPSGEPVSRPPTYGYGTVRSLNYDPSDDIGVFWRDTNPARGVYRWNKLDQWVGTFHGMGKDLIYSFYGTPRWASSRPNVKDLYNQHGGNSKPRDWNDITVFVKALIERYNGDGVRRLKYIEVWNEPDFIGSDYWLDTASDLATLTRVVNQAAKSVDPGIIVLGPAWVNINENTPKIEAFAKASDGAGGTGRQWIDGFAWHHYDWSASIDDLVFRTRWARTYMKRAGWEGMPMYMTEIGGWNWTATSPTNAVKARTIQRWLMVMAAMDQKVAAMYMHDHMEHLGDPSINPDISDAIQRVSAAVTGKTITQAALLTNGTVWLVFSDGTQLNI